MELSFDELWCRAVADHIPWRGKRVQVFVAGISNGDDDCTEEVYNPPIEVTILDGSLDYGLDSTPHDDDGGLLDTYYSATSDNPRVRPGYHVWWVDGPTYYRDGRVEVPGWMEDQDEEDDDDGDGGRA